MRRFFINLFFIFLFSFLFYASALFVWEKFVPLSFKPNLNYRLGEGGYTFTRLKDIKNINNKEVDILFLGSSHAYRGFDSEIFNKNGFTVFNLGSGAQTPIQTNILLERYLDRINPKLVIYEVYPETFVIDGVESSLDIISNDQNDWYSFEMAFKLNNIKTYNVLLYATITDLFNLNSSFHESRRKTNDTYISNGYVKKDLMYYKPSLFDKTEIKFNDDQIEIFEKILKNLKGKNIEVILVYAPITKSLYSSYLNKTYYDSIMKNYAEYYNFNEILILNDSIHFYDSNHLNQNGVDIFNNKLIDILKKR
jgi:hypothetical protein